MKIKILEEVTGKEFLYEIVRELSEIEEPVHYGDVWHFLKLDFGTFFNVIRKYMKEFSSEQWEDRQNSSPSFRNILTHHHLVKYVDVYIVDPRRRDARITIDGIYVYLDLIPKDLLKKIKTQKRVDEETREEFSEFLEQEGLDHEFAPDEVSFEGNSVRAWWD